MIVRNESFGMQERQMKGTRRMLEFRTLMGLALASVVLIGCNSQPEPAPTLSTGTPNREVSELYEPEAEAGVTLDMAAATANVDSVQKIAANRAWASRNDPFSLLAAERVFEQQQALERVLSEGGGFKNEFTPPDYDAQVEAPRRAPVPAWRLSGIVVSEGAVIALLDTGTRVYTINTGQYVEGTNWQCVSIDEEKAIFRRPGNEVPNRIEVPLQGTLPVPGGGSANPPARGNQGSAGGRAGLGGGPANPDGR